MTISIEKLVQGNSSLVSKFNKNSGATRMLYNFIGDGTIQVKWVGNGYAISINWPMLLARLPKSRGGGAAASVQLFVEIMHEPDVGKDYYDVKLDEWAPSWRSGVAYVQADENAQPPVAASVVQYENREYTCRVSHTSTEFITPYMTQYWEEKTSIKAYLYGVQGAIHTTVPQFKRGTRVPIFVENNKYYIAWAFTQGGVASGGVLVVGSIGWIKSENRAGAFFR